MKRPKSDTIPPPTPGRRPVLDAGSLYIGDNGRIHCGAVACAGHAAAFTGRTLHGAPIDPVDPDVVRRWSEMVGAPPACETCGRVATAIAGPSGRSITRERAS